MLLQNCHKIITAAELLDAACHHSQRADCTRPQSAGVYFFFKAPMSTAGLKASPMQFLTSPDEEPHAAAVSWPEDARIPYQHLVRVHPHLTAAADQSGSSSASCDMQVPSQRLLVSTEQSHMSPDHHQSLKPAAGTGGDEQHKATQGAAQGPGRDGAHHGSLWDRCPVSAGRRQSVWRPCRAKKGQQGHGGSHAGCRSSRQTS